MSSRCHYCGCGELARLFTAPGFDGDGRLFTLARCERCRLVNTTGAGEDIVGDAYHAEYYGSGSRKFLATGEALMALLARRRARGIARRWRQHSGSGDAPAVLDVGCGRGLLLRAFKDQGASVLGLEREQFPVEGEMAGLVHVGSLSDEALQGRRFDIVVLWHVLEHLEDIGSALDELCRHLSPGSCLVIAVPNFASLQARLFSRAWFHLDLPRHLAHIESGWLLEQLGRRGFRIEAASHLEPVQSLYGFLQSAMNLLPVGPNAFYRLLKHGGWTSPKNAMGLILWGFLALLLTPFALAETVLAGLLRRGATVQVYARWEGDSHDQ